MRGLVISQVRSPLDAAVLASMTTVALSMSAAEVNLVMHAAVFGETRENIVVGIEAHIVNEDLANLVKASPLYSISHGKFLARESTTQTDETRDSCL